MSEHIRPTHLKAVVALGNNLSPTFTTNHVRRSDGNISVLSKIVTMAVGQFYEVGGAEKIIFSTGYTSGRNYLSEAEAMDKFMDKKFPNIPKKVRLIEDDSIDTAGNAKESIKIIKSLGLNSEEVGLLSLGKHADNASKLFSYHGFPILKQNILRAENILFSSLLTKSPQKAYDFMEDYLDYSLLTGSSTRELARSILLATIDPSGNLLHRITQITRG